MKRTIGLALAAILLWSSGIQAQTSMSFSIAYISLSANAGGAGTIGTAYAAPPGSDAALVTWTTSYSAPPASVTMLLQASLNNSTWFTLDTSTAVGGELRNIATSAKFFRCNISAVSGAVNKTCSFVLKRSNAATSASGTTFAGDVTSGGEFLASNGTAALPSYSFTASPSYGMSLNGVSLQLGTNGTARALFDSNGITATLGAFRAPDGTSGAPSYTFTSEPTLGFWRSSAGVVTTQGSLTVTNGLNVTGGSSLFTIGLSVGATANLVYAGRAAISSPSDGNIVVRNNGATIGSQIKVDALPTIASGFGTGAAVIAGSTPFAGAVNVGTGSPVAGIITFNGTAFPQLPFCVASPWLSTTAVRTSSSTTTLTLTPMSGSFAVSDIVQWICVSAK